jgi:hypothetical protein
VFSNPCEAFASNPVSVQLCNLQINENEIA